MSSMLSVRPSTFQRTLALAGGIAGLFGLGYAIYFDYKRRSAPDYKEKIRENRKKKEAFDVVGCTDEFPNPRDTDENSRFFIEQFARGEELMQMGDFDQAAVHLANAVFASGRPADILQVIQQMLPQEQFRILTSFLPATAIRHRSAMQRYAVIEVPVEIKDEAAPREGPEIIVLDDDLE